MGCSHSPSAEHVPEIFARTPGAGRHDRIISAKLPSHVEGSMADSEEQLGFLDKLRPSHQKKLLALDGGGIRGVITLAVLAAIEEIIRRKLGRPDAVLADYFDYIAGTSTGAIIASGLALGMNVSALRRFYIETGPEMFSRAGVLRRFHYKFDQDRLAAQLKTVFGSDTQLGSRKLRTLLMVVMRNATTD